MTRSAVICAIAIPARNESDLIGRCLWSIADQTVDSAQLAVTIVANNCTDDTADLARSSYWPMHITVIEEQFEPKRAHAGTARRLAMQSAAEQSSIILTTDADCVVDRDWVASILTGFAEGTDAIAGRVSGDWEEMKTHDPAALAIGALEWDYLTLLAEAEARFDPRPHDPMPRHAQECGANIAITRSMLAQVGGVPALACGEDRALLRAVDAAGGRLRHDPRPHVTASARMNGRAAGGMADALTARLGPDYRCDEQFEPARTLVARLKARADARRAWETAPDAARFSFSEVWTRTLSARSDLQPIRIAPDQLEVEIEMLRLLIADART